MFNVPTGGSAQQTSPLPINKPVNYYFSTLSHEYSYFNTNDTASYSGASLQYPTASLHSSEASQYWQTALQHTPNDVVVPPPHSLPYIPRPSSSTSTAVCMPVITQPQFIPFPQSTPATNFNKSNTAAREEPEYDNFAKKKIKLMNKDDQNLQKISNIIVTTLDNLKKNFQSTNVEQPSSNPYSKLLTIAMSKVPVEQQDECMEYVLEGMIEFNKRFQTTKDDKYN
ncbi:uncharacterized protein LOC116416632 [Nasonia vitripennis]|uniref:Uncharacterized protein n=1 Tax=Nasonia vitripennis TaxID=7425 RepID=A0A7M7Q6E8_NASVI|nr:uncharacterized protein LOC116416632 [Nasonia vitripennis]